MQICTAKLHCYWCTTALFSCRQILFQLLKLSLSRSTLFVQQIPICDMSHPISRIKKRDLTSNLMDSKRCERLNYFQYTPIRSISSMLIEPENCVMMVGGQDGQLSAAHISPWQPVSSSQFPPPFCLWRTLLDLKVAEIIPLPTPWLCHCVLMKGSDRGGVTSSKDCLLAFWQIALCGQERGQVARVSFGEAHWTAGGWSTGCGGDWECFSRGTS